MNLKKGNKVLCVENNSTVRPLVIESIDGDKILFSKQLDKGVKKTFSLKKGSFQLIKPRYLSEHEKKEYINPELERHDRVKIIHVSGGDPLNVLGKNATVIGITENSRDDREVMLYVDGVKNMVTLELEYRKRVLNYPHESIEGELVQKSLVYKLDEPQGKQEDYIDDLLSFNLTPQPVNEQTEQLYTGGPEDKKQELSPDLEVGDRIMAWDIEPAIEYPGEGDNPSTFLATVQKVIDYDAEWENAIRYLVKLEDTDEVIGLYGGEVERIPSENGEFTYEGRDKWLKLPKIGITEDTDIFGQGLLDPIEPEDFEGDEEEWEDLVGDVKDDKFVAEPEYDYEGGTTDPTTGFVAPSSEVTDNICKVKGFCSAQGPITFGQLRTLVEAAIQKRIGADIGRGLFKTVWRIVPFFIPQVLLAAVGITVTRAFNKIITPALTDTRGYKSWWGKAVLKAMDVAEGDYIPDVALGDDPLSKIFFISDGLMQMIRDKYKLKFARYVAEVASVMGDDKPVPEWFVENLLRDYLNQKFLLDPPLESKEGTDFQMIREHEEEMDPEDGIQTREPFTRTEAQILNYLSKEFTWEELNTISSVDETQIYGDLDRKWDNTLKLFGQAPRGDEESWIRSTKWAKWAVENWEEAKVEMDGGGYSQDYKKVTNPIKSWPSWFEVDADESYWQKEYRNGTIELGAYDREDAEERAEMSWWDYDPDMDHYDYGDTDDHELDIGDVRYMKALNEGVVDDKFSEKTRKKLKLNPDLMMGDEILVLDTKNPTGASFNPPKLYTPYVVIGIKQSNPHKKLALWQATQEIYYEIEPIDMTDEERLGELVAGGGRRRLTHLYANDRWMLRKGFRRGETLSEHEEVNPSLNRGDRIILIDKIGEDTLFSEVRPELYSPYVIIDKSPLYSAESGGKKVERFQHKVVKVDDYEYYKEWLERGADEVPSPQKILHPHLYRWIPADKKTINEHKESKISPDLEPGDIIRVIDIKDVERPNKPERFGVYKVQSKGMPPIVLANDSVAPWYELRPVEPLKPGYHIHSSPKRVYWGDTWIYADVDRKTISEHKESRISPDLDKGDIIRVIEVDGEHANMPDIWGVYKVHDVKQDNATQEFYYELSGETSEVVQDSTFSTTRLTNTKYLYHGDTWIYADVDRKTISEHKESGLNPELGYGDTILVIDIDREREDGKTMYTSPPEGFRPERYIPYTVVDKESAGHKSEWDYKYTLVPEDKVEDYEKNLDRGYGDYETYEKLLFPWVYQWIYANTPTANKVDRLTISEHKESKLNPELMIGDEILVVADGHESYGDRPELYMPYVVTSIKKPNKYQPSNAETYYGLEPIGMTDEYRLSAMLAGGGKRRETLLYPGDDWILEPGFLRGELNEQQFPFNPENKKIEKDHPKGEPDWSIRRGRQHYAMNVEDTRNESVTAFNNYLVENSPFNFLAFDYYITAVPDNMPASARIDVFIPMLDTGKNADELWSGKRITYFEDLGIDDYDYDYEEEEDAPYIRQNVLLHDIPYNERYGEYYEEDERFRDTYPEEALKYDNRETDYLNYPGALYNRSWLERFNELRNEMEEIGKLFGIERILINRYPDRPWSRQGDSYGNENIRPGKDVPRGEHLTEEKESGGVWDYIFGDSIAVGFSVWTPNRLGDYPGRGNELKTDRGWSREGAWPSEILGNIKTFIETHDLNGKKVFLSSGYSNGQDLDNISNEIDVLNGTGANVYLLGVSNTFPKKGEHNVILSGIAKEKGAIFLGGFDAPKDNVHPSNYNTLYNSITSINEHEEKETDRESQYVVQDIVNRVYPHIVNNLGKSIYVDETPQVELSKDIYARYSGIEGMEGEHSSTSKAEYDDYENKIFIYYPNMEDTEDVIRSLLHEYTHSLQDPDERKGHREEGYEKDPDEIEAAEAELNWTDYLVYLQDNLMEEKEISSPIFTVRLIKTLQYLFEVYDINNEGQFREVLRNTFNLETWDSETLYITLKYNASSTHNSTIKDILNYFKPEDFKIPSLYEYEVVHYSDYSENQEEEDCEVENGYGYESGDECKCLKGTKEVEDKEGNTEYKECDDDELEDINYDNDCECEEWDTKYYDIYYWNIKTINILSFTPAEHTDSNSNYSYGYDDYDDFISELDNDYVITEEYEDDDYDEGTSWENFDDSKEGQIIGMDTNHFPQEEVENDLRSAINKITTPSVKKLEEQYDMMTQREHKMKDLTSQIFQVLDDSFDILPNPHGEIEYDGKKMALYSYHQESFVDFDHIYDPIIQMIEGGIQQEDIEIFVDIITDWVNYVMSEKREHLNEEVNIKDPSGEYTQEDYQPFINFVIDELDIQNPIDVIIQSDIPDGTTAKYTRKPVDKRKIIVKNNGRKLIDMLRSIAHELVHHKQNEIGKVDDYANQFGAIPNIGGEIEDEANAIAGQLIKKYGEIMPQVYNENIKKGIIKKILRENLLIEDKVVNFDSPTNNFVVIAGGPGAGKSFITKNLINLDNVKEFNVDQVRVMTAKNLWGDEWEEKISTPEGYQQILDRTYTTSDPRNLTVKYLKHFLAQDRDQPVNVVYDAGGGQEEVMKDVHKIAKDSRMVTNLIYVRTPLELAQIRNNERPRSLPDDMVAQYHQKVKDNMRNMIPFFDHVWIIDNKDLIDLSARPSENIEKIK